MKPSLSRSIFSGMAASMVGQALVFGQSLLLLPLFLKAWGTTGYGRWVGTTSILAYLALLDLGGQSHIGNVLTAAQARGDAKKFAVTLSDALSFYIALGLAVYSALACATLYFWVHAVPFVGRSLTRDECLITLFLGANLLLLSVPGGVFVSVYRACDRFTRGAMLGNGMRFFVLLCSAAALWSGVSQGAYAGVGLACSAFATAVYWFDARRHLHGVGEIKLSLRCVIEGARHLRTSYQVSLTSFAQMSMQQGVIIVLAALLPASAIAVYVAHRLVASMVGTLCSVAQGPIQPELTALWAKGNIVEMRSMNRNAVLMLVIGAGIASFLIWIVAPGVFPWWTGGRMHLQPPLLAVLLFQAVLSTGWNSSIWSMQATSEFKPITVWTAANAVVTLILTVLAARTGRLELVAAASLGGDLMCAFLPFPYLASRHDASHWISYYKSITSGMLVVAPLALIALAMAGSLKMTLPVAASCSALFGVLLVLRARSRAAAL